ncbi:MAG: hypothetical protein J1E38_04080 [Paramuribaculum sp.]|nr:hypothetical protein [Paramuribaculum sp.]
MKKNANDKWNERHFQICLALLSRPVVPDSFGYTKPLNLLDVITKADRMIALLQQRERRERDNV